MLGRFCLEELPHLADQRGEPGERGDGFERLPADGVDFAWLWRELVIAGIREQVTEVVVRVRRLASARVGGNGMAVDIDRQIRGMGDDPLQACGRDAGLFNGFTHRGGEWRFTGINMPAGL